MIVIVNYGMGNIGSILNMLKKIGASAVISSDVDEISKAEKLILPGVGAFDNGMKNLKEYGLIDILNKKVLVEKTPILGICLGMQLFSKGSEEGILEGLGWIDAETKKFSFKDENKHLRIPHMGWNEIKIKGVDEIFKIVLENPRFYFVHSYHVICKNQSDVLATTMYGTEFHSAVHKENITGTQFHPEKSHKFGIQVFKNFTGLG